MRGLSPSLLRAGRALVLGRRLLRVCVSFKLARTDHICALPEGNEGLARCVDGSISRRGARVVRSYR